MAAKKTLEELRTSQRERARRWREKNRRKHLERVKEVYGRSNAQKFSSDGVTPGELERYEKKVVQETRHVPIAEAEGNEEVMAEHQQRMEKYRPPVVPVEKGPEGRVVYSQEEKRVAGQLERFKAKREAREVEVEM